MFTSMMYPGNSQASLLGALFISSTLIAGCASTEQRVEPAANLAVGKASPVDPYEGFNRSMYGFNMGLDRYFFKPVANGYKYVTPDFMETGVSNFFNNLKGINVVLNDVLQGKFEQSASDTGRFLTNTTVGVVGLFDVASDLGLQSNVEDFGQTLAVWGVDEGAYLVLPIMGPTTVRDGGAVIVDKAANPGTYVPGTGIIEGINDRANAEGALNFIDEAALDPYVFTRESFLQYRRNLVNDGKTDTSSYDLDVDAAMEETSANDASMQKKNSTDRSAVGNSGKLNQPLAPIAKQTSAVTTSVAASPAFENMAKSFENADIKMNRISKKKIRRKR